MKKATMRAGKEEKNENSSLLKGGEIIQRDSFFGKYADAEMLSQLKRLALDPCNPRVSPDSIQPLWNQTLRLRKVLTLGHTECPRRKRKLAQFLKDKFIASAGLASKVSSSTQENGAKLSKGQLSHASSVSCLLNTVDSIESLDQKTLLNSSSSGLTFEDNLQGKLISSGISYLDNVADWTVTNKDISLLVDSDESVNGSNPVTPEKPNHRESPSLDCYESVHSSNSQKKKSKGTYLQARRRSIRLQNFIGDHLQRLTIPIGPRFQADVPDWADPDPNDYLTSKYSDSENSKWLGTRIWPIEGRKLGANTITVGKGRPDSCSCGSPGSTDCIKHHISEKKSLSSI